MGRIEGSPPGSRRNLASNTRSPSPPMGFIAPEYEHRGMEQNLLSSGIREGMEAKQRAGLICLALQASSRAYHRPRQAVGLESISIWITAWKARKRIQV